MLESWCRQVLIMAARKPRIMFTCSEETKQVLEEWSEDEGRTMSNLVERIVVDAIANRNAQKQPKHEKEAS
ncbi:hypothetical protein Cylst_6518 (plasmid) [Cylindrospermum stagnale PCC 7417]|uniref:CopG-like ribbon-helix-helix domain-containing protein n=2 Tax=Cylindrospermum stagnale TaxID=142864 RepID=K9X9F7_9NOST|nr:hypothetical protein Cylst_6518 [Cylindrospermum stagnale PCC 7417]